MRLGNVIPISLVVLATAMACAPSQTGQQSGTGPLAATPGAHRGTLKIAWMREAESLHPKFYLGPGMAEYGWTFNSWLTYLDFGGVSHPMMARELPTRDNGDWVVNTDGTMVTTYRLRPNIKWHDGAHVTARDFAFGFEVYVDPDLPVTNRAPESFMSSVEAPDDLTIVISWKVPYVSANALGYQMLDPLPRHLLEEKYRTNKPQFTFGEEWRSGYVGAGPFRVESWDPGTSILARANDDWFLGPPKLASIDIRIIPDTNTLLVNLLSGDVQMSNSPSLRGNEAVFARDQWAARSEGYTKVWETRLRYMHFQYRDVQNWQPAVTDVSIRRALMHAMDRQALVEGVNFGLGEPADAYFLPSDALFPEVDRAVSKYPYDPGRASTLLTERGWRRTSDTGLITDSTGQTLALPVWRSAGPSDEKELSIIADFWKAVGINSQIYIIPSARRDDNEFQSSFPGGFVAARTISPDGFVWVSDQVAAAESRWTGSNRGSFHDPEIDRLAKQTTTLLDVKERNEATLALHRRTTDLVGFGPLYYEIEVIVARSNVKGPVGNYGPQQGITWNVFEWEVNE
ncbi:MAG TPA: peptide ABC transporter substrate-binding protein [Chloroflexota bacterium]